MRKHCCRHIVAHDVSLHTQTEKHFLRTQNVSGQNQKHVLRPGHKIVLQMLQANVARTGKRGNICVGNNVPATMCPCLAVLKGTGKHGHTVADTLLFMMFLGLHKLGNICCGHKMLQNKIRNIFCVPDTN